MVRNKHKQDKKLHNFGEKLHNSNEPDLSWQEEIDLLPEDENDSGSENEDISRMTIVVTGDDTVVEQVTKQLNKLIEIIKVSDLTKEAFVDRELVLIKVTAERSDRAEIMQLVDIFRARIVDVAAKSPLIEATGNAGKIAALIGILKQFGIKEIVRMGTLALGRGTKVI